MAEARVRSLLLVVTVISIAVEQSSGQSCVDLVKDCGGKADNHTDNAQAFAVCQHLASQRSGCITVPAGPFRLTQVVLNVSNIDIRMDNGVVMYPMVGQKGSSAMFQVGISTPETVEYVQNVSIRGRAPGQFTVDVSVAQMDPWKEHAVALTGGVKNFVIANMLCRMSNPVVNPETKYQSSSPCISSNFASVHNTRLNPQEGEVENVTCTGCVHGYGLIQIRSGEKITARNLYSEGGVTLRMETGDGPDGYVGDIFGENITCKDGAAAMIAGPHCQKNGAFHVKDVTSIGCYKTVGIGAGFAQHGAPPGYFSNSSTVTNIVSIYGTQAQQNKSSLPTPSCGACLHSQEASVYLYNVSVTNLKTVGFPRPSDRTQCRVALHNGSCPFDV